MKNNRLSILRLSKVILLVLALISCGQCIGQESASKIDQKDLKAIIKTLSSTQFEGRDIDNYGQIKTQEYIINRFKTLQVEPFSTDGYLEKFFLNQTGWGDEYILTKKKRKLRNFDRMVFTGGNQLNEEIEKEIVFGGFGTAEELEQIDVANRFVLILSTSQREEIAVKQRLYERNASGLIVFHKDDKSFESMKRTVKAHHAIKRYSIADCPNITLTDRSDETLFDDPRITTFLSAMSGINTIVIPGSEVKNVMGLSKKKLIDLANKREINMVPPSVIRIKLARVTKTIETANVIGIIRGESDQTIILSAHYDHLGKDEKLYYPGADDNASGIAAMLEIAEEFAQYKKLKYTMVFLATTAEELGLLGSQYHVEKPDFNPEKVICSFHFDMISRCDDRQADCNYLYCIDNGQSNVLDSLIRKADELFPHCTFDYSKNNSDIFSRTDAYNFMKKGIPSILFFAGFHDDYHKPTDTMDKIDFEVLENRIKLICEVIKLLQEVNE